MATTLPLACFWLQLQRMIPRSTAAGPVAADRQITLDPQAPVWLLALAASDGRELARYPLDAPPVFDGLAAARGRLYAALENGRVVCLGPR